MNLTKAQKKIVGILCLIVGVLFIGGGSVLAMNSAEMKSYKQQLTAKLEDTVAELDMDDYSLDAQEEITGIVDTGKDRIDLATSEKAAKKAYKDAVAKINQVPTLAAEAKEAGREKLAEYEKTIKPELYTEEQQEAIKGLIDGAKTEIDGVETEDAAEVIYNRVVEQIGAMPTVLDTQRQAALDEIDQISAAWDASKYDYNAIAQQQQIVSSARMTIQNAQSEAEIKSAVDAAKAAIAGLKPKPVTDSSNQTQTPVQAQTQPQMSNTVQ